MVINTLNDMLLETSGITQSITLYHKGGYVKGIRILSKGESDRATRQKKKLMSIILPHSWVRCPVVLRRSLVRLRW
jgi:hypothetical protein